MWPDVRAAFGRVRRFAAVLADGKGPDAATARRRYRGLVAALARHRTSCGSLTGALDHLLKVTRGCWLGLFRCYDVADLPRTNNDPEQFFGSYRYHERRASGRKVACPGTVVRGSVRLIAEAATRTRSIGVADPIPTDLEAWRGLRRSLGRRRAVRALGRRFRRDPVAYLRALEGALIDQALPS
jgi:hypothetical protein